MKNKELRKEIIENGTYQNYSKRRYELFENFKDYDINQLKDINYYEIENHEIFKECENLRKCKKEQVSKVKNHLNWWLKYRDNYDIFFMTFTYDSKKRRKEMDPQTLKTYIIRNISKSVEDYCINIDYGEKNERLHYHGFVVCKKGHVIETKTQKDIHKNRYVSTSKLDFMNDYENKIGFYSALPLRLNGTIAAEKISKYMAKLWQHAIKTSQSYISVKKGSLYQKWKKARKEELDLFLGKGASPMEVQTSITRKIETAQEKGEIGQIMDSFNQDIEMKDFIEKRYRWLYRNNLYTTEDIENEFYKEKARKEEKKKRFEITIPNA